MTVKNIDKDNVLFREIDIFFLDKGEKQGRKIKVSNPIMAWNVFKQAQVGDLIRVDNLGMLTITYLKQRWSCNDKGDLIPCFYVICRRGM